MQQSIQSSSPRMCFFAALLATICVSCDGPGSWESRADICVTVDGEHSADEIAREREESQAARVIQTAPPAGSVMFFKTRGTCPEGWLLDPDLQGRFILGNPSGGTAGKVSSSSAITSNGAQPTHSHVFSGTAAKAQTTSSSNTTSVYPSISSSSANLPYIQLTACVAQTSQDPSSHP